MPFAWFGSRSCPIEPEVREWIDRRWDWLGRAFGVERMLESRLVLPRPEFFPRSSRDHPDYLQATLESVCSYMGVDPRSIHLNVYQEMNLVDRRGRPLGSAGLYQKVNETYEIWIEVRTLDYIHTIVSTIAHELGHVLLLGEGRISSDEEDHEHLTDLLTVFLGLGVFSANTVIREENWTSDGANFTITSRSGYLTMPMYAYALALYARDRGETRPAWTRELRPDVRSPFKQSLRYLASQSPRG